MQKDNKTNTYLDEFGIYTKLTYDKIGRFKSIFWILIFSIALEIQYMAIVSLRTVVRISSSFLKTYIDSSSKIAKFQYGLSPSIIDLLNLAIPTGVVILFFYMYIKIIERRSFSTTGLNQHYKLRKYVKGTFVAITMQLSYFFIILLFDWGEVVTGTVHDTAIGSSTVGIVLLFLVGFMVQGASEEIVVRGWMMPVLARQYKIPTAIAITSVFFGILHIFNPNISILSEVNLILYGIFAALYAIYDGGLWGIFAQHSIWNWFMGNVLGLPVSGVIVGKVSLIETKLTGPTVITGGNFGPEGGMIVSLIEIVGIIVVARLLIKQNLKS